MSETCEFYATNWGKGPAQTLIGRVLLDNGKLQFKAVKGHETFMKEVKDAKLNVVGKKRFDQTKNPEGWFRSLPIEYRGTMLRALLTKKGN